MRVTGAAMMAAVTLAIWVGANCDSSPAQTQGRPVSTAAGAGSTAESDHLAPKKSLASPVAGGGQGQDSASGDSKDENSDTPFGAFTSSNRGPISIQSDSLALDYKQNAVVFRGHVHATQADGALTSNTLNVKYGKDFHQLQDMVADGNVHISQGVRWCTSEHAVMDQQQHTVILTGSPICHDARDQIAGTKITVHLDTGKSDVEAAKAMIFPQPSKTRDNEALADHMK